MKAWSRNNTIPRRGLFLKDFWKCFFSAQDRVDRPVGGADQRALQLLFGGCRRGGIVSGGQAGGGGRGSLDEGHLHHRALLHLQQSHQRRLREHLAQHQRRKDILHPGHAHRMWVVASQNWRPLFEWIPWSGFCPSFDFFRHCETCIENFLMSPKVPPFNFLIFCSRMDVQKNFPPLHFLALCDLPETSKHFGKNRSSIFSFLRGFVVSSYGKSGFRVLLSLSYGADLGRARLVFAGVAISLSIVDISGFIEKWKKFISSNECLDHGFDITSFFSLNR